jgi:hypothetical protein
MNQYTPPITQARRMNTKSKRLMFRIMNKTIQQLTNKYFVILQRYIQAYIQTYTQAYIHTLYNVYDMGEYI